ncbi:Mbov_0396 family ICE element transmembrane protein, partial [Candidatus Mycoplasma pogonae]
MWLFTPLFFGLHQMFWILVSLPFQILKSVLGLYKYIANSLPNILMFGSKNGEIEDWNKTILPTPFLSLIIVAALLFSLFLLIAIVKIAVDKVKRESRGPGLYSLIRVVPSILFIVFVPLGVFLLFWATDLIFELINKAFGDDQSSIAKKIFISLKPKSINLNEWEIMADNDFKSMNYSDYQNLEWGEGFQIILTLGIIGIILSFIFLLAALSLIQKVFQQFFLFIISPLVAPTILLDAGKRIKTWQQLFLAKTLAIQGFLIGMNVFVIYTNLISGWVNTLEDWTPISRQLFLILLLMGGALGVSSLTSLITEFVGEGMSTRETLGETASLMKTGMSLAVAGGTAFKFAKSLPKKAIPKSFRSAEQGILDKQLKAGQLTPAEYQRQKAEIRK